MRIHDISRDLLRTPPYPGDPEPVLETLTNFSPDEPFRVSRISASCHAGTHADAPAHCFPDAPAAGDLPPEVFVGPCRVVAVYEPLLTGADIDAMDLRGVDRLLIKGFEKARLTRSAAHALAAEGIRLVGIDAPGIAAEGEDASVHRALLGAGVAILENLDLGRVRSGDYFLCAAPVRMGNAEAAFCRALLLDDFDF